MKALRLGVNVDHVATVRNARGGSVPDPVRAALMAIEAGADGITAHLDVRDEARRVRCPTLIMHSRGDHRVPMRSGEELAALIPGARLLGLDSNNHLLTAAEPAWAVFRAEVAEFLG